MATGLDDPRSQEATRAFGSRMAELDAQRQTRLGELLTQSQLNELSELTELARVEEIWRTFWDEADIFPANPRKPTSPPER